MESWAVVGQHFGEPTIGGPEHEGYQHEWPVLKIAGNLE